ncbi:MAG: phosphodiester glycosidase family protein [Bacteroidales bacterium]
MKNFVRLIAAFLLPALVFGQTITWEDVSSNYEFPSGLKLFHGTISGNNTFAAWYLEVDMSNPEIAVRPYLRPSSAQVNAFTAEVGAYAAINAGFFSGSSSVSSVIYPGEVPARNLISVNRTVGGVTRTYPVIRPIFALNSDRSLATEWVYHHSYNFDDIYVYEQPMPYQCDDPNPLPVPVKANGYQYEDIAYGIGGGPMLIKDGQINIDYCEGIWWGSGVLLTDFRPRTAVGYTADQRVLLFITNHMKIGDMAQELLNLGCIGAMNLDGGGSTAMAVGSQSIYDQARAVPSILAVVHADSLNIPKVPTFEKFIDTADEGVTFAGSWIETANPGSWESPSKLHPLGTNEQYYDFPLNLPKAGEYEIYAWWTAHSNRAADAPFFVTHAEGVTEVAMNQTQGGSMWNLVGTFQFNGTQEEAVRITAAATTNDWVVADGIRIVSYSPDFNVNTIVSIQPVDDVMVVLGTPLAQALALLSPHTTITDSSGETHTVALTWSAPGYDGNVPGVYTAKATFTLPQGVVQSNPPVDLEVTASITVQDNTSVAVWEAENMVVFPNPNSGSFKIEGNFSQNWQLQIYSMDGKLIREETPQGIFSIEIELGDNARGIYVLRLLGEHHSRVQKIVVR